MFNWIRFPGSAGRKLDYQGATWLGLPGKGGAVQSAPLRLEVETEGECWVDRRTWIKIAAGSVGAPAALWGAWQFRDEVFEKRFAVVVPGQLYRGAWQRPIPLRRILARERIKTVVTLTAINKDDPKYVDQAKVLGPLGIGWRFVPIHGSYATVKQMARAADLLADPGLHPIFFHCIAGHHRSSQAHAAYRMQHDGWTPARAWAEVAALPWARPKTDVGDHRLIEAFAHAYPHPNPHAEGRV